MGKVKRQARKHSNHHDALKHKLTVARRQHSQQPKPQPGKNVAQKANSKAQQPRLKVPFTKNDNVLLVGEGDFSFSLALKRHHKTGQITTTCFDSKDVLVTKHPDVRQNIAQLASTVHGENPGRDETEWKGFSPSPPRLSDLQGDTGSEGVQVHSPITVLYGIDATKLFSAHKKALRPCSPFTKIVFNFPHVGGLSTDVNRQVRYNQELLVGFFKSAKPLLSSPAHPARLPQPTQEDASDYDEMVEESDRRSLGAVIGQVLVTIFEGEPYTLWNVRDLARHCGLKVVESFKFPWSAYPGYKHARTTGDIANGMDRSDEGKRKGAWRGEERDARCYVLEDKDASSGAWSKKTRKHGDQGHDND